MPTKKPGSARGSAARLIGTDLDTTRVLAEIQQKVNSSPALNGGFDTLLYKVDKIEESQGKIVSTVDKIHAAIYEPDTGLFSRINTVQATASKENGELEKQLIELNTWKAQTEKSAQEDKTSDEALVKKVEEQQKVIEQLTQWKATVSKVGAWIGMGFGGGAVTLLFKILYDVLTTHWK
jgi:hypothetical protein